MFVDEITMTPEMIRSLILHQMMESEFPFYLTGSRFFGGYANGSDWDFFAAHEHKTFEFLQGLGFVDLTLNVRYNDTGIIGVLRHPTGVDVQFVCDCKKRVMIRNSIKKVFPRFRGGKYGKSLIWNLAYILVDKACSLD